MIKKQKLTEKQRKSLLEELLYCLEDCHEIMKNAEDEKVFLSLYDGYTSVSRYATLNDIKKICDISKIECETERLEAIKNKFGLSDDTIGNIVKKLNNGIVEYYNFELMKLSTQEFKELVSTTLKLNKKEEFHEESKLSYDQEKEFIELNQEIIKNLLKDISYEGKTYISYKELLQHINPLLKDMEQSYKELSTNIVSKNKYDKYQELSAKIIAFNKDKYLYCIHYSSVKRVITSRYMMYVLASYSKKYRAIFDEDNQNKQIFIKFITIYRNPKDCRDPAGYGKYIKFYEELFDLFAEEDDKAQILNSITKLGYYCIGGGDFNQDIFEVTKTVYNLFLRYCYDDRTKIVIDTEILKKLPATEDPSDIEISEIFKDTLYESYVQEYSDKSEIKSGIICYTIMYKLLRNINHHNLDYINNYKELRQFLYSSAENIKQNKELIQKIKDYNVNDSIDDDDDDSIDKKTLRVFSMARNIILRVHLIITFLSYSYQCKKIIHDNKYDNRKVPKFIDARNLKRLTELYYTLSKDDTKTIINSDQAESIKILIYKLEMYHASAQQEPALISELSESRKQNIAHYYESSQSINDSVLNRMEILDSEQLSQDSEQSSQDSEQLSRSLLISDMQKDFSQLIASFRTIGGTLLVESLEGNFKQFAIENEIITPHSSSQQISAIPQSHIITDSKNQDSNYEDDEEDKHDEGLQEINTSHTANYMYKKDSYKASRYFEWLE